MEFLGGARDEDVAVRAVDRLVDHWKDHGFGIYAVEVEGFENPVGRVGSTCWTRSPGSRSS